LDVTRLPVQYFMPDSNRVRVIPGDGFYDGGNASYWHDHWVDEWTLIGSITSHAIENHQLKAGFNARFQEMQLIDIVQPYLNDGWGSSQDIYKVSPAMGGLYLQDDITFSGMILNAGVRLDYWFPGKYVDDAIADTSLFILTPAMRQQYKDETYSLFDRRFKMRISPRIGVSHPVSENMMLFFNYGHFSKWPKPQFVYAKLGPTSASGSFQKFGNPNLNPETTVSYELGVRNKFSKDDVLSVTAFYKDIFDYIQTTTIRGIPRIGSAVFYLNLDYARSRGIEIDYKTRIGNNFTASLGGSYSIVTTKNSSPNVQDLIYLGVIDEEPIRETFAIWDRPLQGNMSLNYYRPKNDKWDLFGLDMPTDWNLNFYWVAMSGKRYTPAVFDQNDPLTGRPLYSSTRDEDQLNSKIGGIWSWADLTFEKYFDLTEQMKMTFSLEVLNIFNFKNTNIVNPVTGRAYEYGDPVPSSWNDPLYPDISWPISEPYPFNPARYKNPRNIRAGLSLTF
jgi:outer membrane receptor protein involved in Fe transport